VSQRRNPLSLSEISTIGASYRDDLRAYAMAGFDGIGIWETKLRDDAADLEALWASGLRATNCVPAVPSILPNAVIDGPADVEERIRLLCASMHRLGRYEPDCVLCLTGPAGALKQDARPVVIEGLKRVAAAADEAGVWLGLEPIHATQRDALSMVTTIPETLGLLDEADLPQVGLMVDLWHVGDTSEVERHLREHLSRISGVHVADWFPAARPDRALPQAGASRSQQLMAVLSEAGWNGAWDIEIFGDPDNADSLWSLPVDEAARRAYEAAVQTLPYERR